MKTNETEVYILCIMRQNAPTFDDGTKAKDWRDFMHSRRCMERQTRKAAQWAYELTRTAESFMAQGQDADSAIEAAFLATGGPERNVVEYMMMVMCVYRWRYREQFLSWHNCWVMAPEVPEDEARACQDVALPAWNADTADVPLKDLGPWADWAQPVDIVQ